MPHIILTTIIMKTKGLQLACIVEWTHGQVIIVAWLMERRAPFYSHCVELVISDIIEICK